MSTLNNTISQGQWYGNPPFPLLFRAIGPVQYSLVNRDLFRILVAPELFAPVILYLGFLQLLNIPSLEDPRY